MPRAAVSFLSTRNAGRFRARHPRSALGVLAVCSVLAGLTITASAETSDCRALLAGAQNLVLVTVRTMNVPDARLRLLTRDAVSNAWQPLGPVEPAVVGSAGLAWGDSYGGMARGNELVKVEGDRRTPAGLYRIGRSFGFGPDRRPGHLALRPGETICVDDPSSPAYNTIATRAPGETLRGEDMGAEPLYRRGLVIDYPSDAGRRAGSCIFLHVWRGLGHGTAGCVALPEARVAALQDVTARGPSVIAILPDQALDRFADCLPGIRDGR